MTFRQKTFSSLKWSGLENFFQFLFSFTTSVILARLLNPEDFGLIAMVSIFIALSRTLIDGGFGDSLIRKINCDDRDYNTIFTFNVILAFILYFFLFLLAPSISVYLGIAAIDIVIKVSSLGIIFSSFSIVQIAILRKKMEFKKQAVISFISSFISGSLSILLAFYDFKYWSLILPVLVNSIIFTILLWRFSEWRPKFRIDFRLLREHFSFGYKIMLSSIVHTIGINIHNTFIGKLFSPNQLGFFSRADNIQKLPSSNLDNMVRHITYPLLASISNDETNLVSKFKLIITYTVFTNASIMLLLNLVSEELISLLYGSRWVESAVYLKILCFVGIVQPLISINANLLNVKGKSEITLFALFVNLILTVPVILLGCQFGLEILTYGILFVSIAYYFIIIFFVSQYSSFNFTSQLRNVLKTLIIPLTTFFITSIVSSIDNINLIAGLIIKVTLFSIIFSLLSYYTKSIVFFEIIDLMKSKINKMLNYNYLNK